MICLTCLAVLFTWLTKLTMNKSVICTTMTSCLFSLLFLGFMIFGSVLVVPGTLGDQFIQENCKLVKEQKFDEMSPFFRDIFTWIDVLDNELDESVNGNMCTDSCKCLNDENQTIKKIYDQFDEDTFRSFGRTKGPIDNADGYGYKALKYQIDASDKGYETMLDCVNDIEARKANAG